MVIQLDIKTKRPDTNVSMTGLPNLGMLSLKPKVTVVPKCWSSSIFNCFDSQSRILFKSIVDQNSVKYLMRTCLKLYVALSLFSCTLVFSINHYIRLKLVVINNRLYHSKVATWLFNTYIFLQPKHQIHSYFLASQISIGDSFLSRNLLYAIS